GQRPARQGCVTSRDYYWNNHGEVGTIDDGLRGSVVYSYDRSGYLTGRSGQMYDHDRYYYDKAGNLLDNEGQGPVMNNRLPGCGRDRYGYNEWGELTTRRDQQLEWNAQGQLTRVISGNTETHYGYDALGRRTRKATYGRHTGHTARSRTDFVWEGFRLLQENVQQQGWRTYLYDAEQPYTPVASVTGRGESRQVWYYHTDVTGTPQEVTAADGTLVWAGYIRGFGENAADISNSGAYFHQPLRLPGQYFDDETGLHYNLFRYYAPECGRFVSQDPIGLAGGINLYSYAPNPIKWMDPLGLHDILADTDIVCRGGACSADSFKNGSGVAADANGKLSGISTQAKPNAGLETLSQPFKHNQIGVATVADIEKAGGTITLDGKLNSSNGSMMMNHATVDGLTAEQAEKLFRPTQPNPVPVEQRGPKRGC
ncbi:RHS repeat protein, partial [Salmonella enterica subsp. enterica serovar Uganda]|nr:RHS repeat protein [Salmonella enterica subsp. enterica serovar Uganda]ECJ0249432.1 RHS repeat protein [Salmonella enterica subsp. enterica serovar Uganda]EDT1627390.1 RHS repeat protein [Salmonella enterica subsp. enterica serovar Uganda]EHM0994391.1 RHS repeat protein [Salmonella enterica subsp. enterica serovar Uganda]EHP8390951.1 RHS repeat protein [Salmonella enterica subsp. enterica serovar Uganda]